MTIKDEIQYILGLPGNENKFLESALADLPDKPTVLIVVEGGVANYFTLPAPEPCPVNVVLIDLDSESLDEIRVQREE